MKTKHLCAIAGVLTLLAATGSACNAGSPFASPIQSPLTTPLSLAVSDETRAIEIGKTGCSVSRSVQDEAPYNIRAQLLPLSEADKLVNDSGSKSSYNLPSDTLVWVVQMQGKWHTEGGPLPTRAPNEAIVYYTQCSVLINAQTGYFMGYRLK